MTGLLDFDSYEKYQPTNLKWCDEIPSHWIVSKASFEFAARKGGRGQELTKEFCAAFDGEYPVYSGQTENNGVMGTLPDYEFDFGSLGVLFSTTVGAKAMSLQHLRGKFSLSQNCMIFENRSDRVNTKYFYYALQPLFDHERNQIPEHMQASFRMEDFYDYRLYVPPTKEQKKIAQFLDHETTKIDTLIEKQKRLIELLKEKRQAVISHAVTKGLNPDAPMKDSGVEWLGEIPVGWVLAGFPLYISEVVDYRGRTPTKVDDGVFLVTAKNIKNGLINYDASAEYILSSEYAAVMSRGIPTIGDVLFTTEAPLGEVAQVDRIDIALAQRVMKFSARKGVLNNRFLLFFIMSKQFQYSLVKYATGSTALGIKAARLNYLRIVFPSYREQGEIVGHIDKETSNIDFLENRASQTASLLLEKKQTLISAAVTGKINVQNWQPPTNATEATA